MCNDRLWYLYTLSHRGNVFYVGVSQDLLNRYKSHCTEMYGRCYNTIHWIKQDGELPDLNILNSFASIYDAWMAEMSLIRHFVTIKHKLRNIDCNAPFNILIDCIPVKGCNDKVKMKDNYAHAVIKTAFDNYKLLPRYEYKPR